VSFVDHQVGRLMETLKECGYHDNTIVIFTSDHGDMLGERGLWFKQTMYDQAVRVPLLFWGPRWITPGRTGHNVSLLSVFSTVLDGTGASPVDDREESLWPLLTGRRTEMSDCIYCEHTDANALCPILMVRRGPHKYIYSEKWGCRLFNLVDDPKEEVDLIDDPSMAQIRGALHDLVLARWGDPGALRDRIVRDQNRRRLVWQCLTRGKRPVWDYQPFEDQTRKYVRSDRFLFDTESDSILRLDDGPDAGAGTGPGKTPTAR
jgi:choline-sulfatase